MQRRIDRTRNKKNLNNKTVPFNDPSSPSELIEIPISKLMSEIHKFYVMELNDDEGFSYAYEFIEKYMKIHGIKSTNTNIAVKTLFPLFIQQPTTNYIDFYDFLLRKGYGDISDVQMHLIHAAVLGNNNFVRYILQHVPEINIEFALEMALGSTFKLLLDYKIMQRKKRELSISDSLDLSFSQQNFTEDSINPYVDDSIGEIPFSESPIAMVNGRNYDLLESPSFSNSTSNSFYSEQSISFDSLMLQEFPVTKDDIDLQKRIKELDAEAEAMLKKLQMAMNDVSGQPEDSSELSGSFDRLMMQKSQVSQNEDLDLQEMIRLSNENADAVIKGIEMELKEAGIEPKQIGSFEKSQIEAMDIQQRIKLLDAQATEVSKMLKIAIKETKIMLGMVENSEEELITPSPINVYTDIQKLIASISPYKPPRISSDLENITLTLSGLKMSASKIKPTDSTKKRQIPVLDLDRELNLEESFSGLTQFGVFKAEKQETKKDSESYIPQIPK